MKSTFKNRNESHSQAAVTRGGARLGSYNGGKTKPLTQGAESSAGVDSAPRVALQRKQLHAAFGQAIQRQAGPEEEELLQGKFPTVQRQSPEEEKLLQGKFGPVQRQGPEEEELLQGKFAPVQRQGAEEDELLQGKFEAIQRQGPEEEELLQGKFGSAQMKQEPGSQANNTGLPDNLKSGIESLSGMSMDNVKVHYNSGKPAQLNALAYAQGSDIHVAPGQQRHLPHEAWHVVQQAQGRVRPKVQRKDGVPINDDAILEREADVMGAKAMQGKEKKGSDSFNARSVQLMQENGTPREGAYLRVETFGANWSTLDRKAYMQSHGLKETSNKFVEDKYVQKLSDGSIILTDTTGQYWRHEHAENVGQYYDSTHTVNNNNADTHFWISSKQQKKVEAAIQLKGTVKGVGP